MGRRVSVCAVQKEQGINISPYEAMFGVSEIPREALQKITKEALLKQNPNSGSSTCINSQQMCEICSRKVKTREATNASLKSQADKMLKRSKQNFHLQV